MKVLIAVLVLAAASTSALALPIGTPHVSGVQVVDVASSDRHRATAAQRRPRARPYANYYHYNYTYNPLNWRTYDPDPFIRQYLLIDPPDHRGTIY